MYSNALSKKAIQNTFLFDNVKLGKSATKCWKEMPVSSNPAFPHFQWLREETANLGGFTENPFIMVSL